MATDERFEPAREEVSDDSRRRDRQGAEIDRRDAIKLGAAATIAASLGLVAPLGAQAAGATAAARATFFTPAELALVDELSELIIPTDGHSPGARAAKVADYIDGRLAEAWEEKDRTDWRDGLKAIEQVSQDLNRKTFMQSSADERIAVLTRIARNEANPERPEEKFFVELKSRVANAYYTSEIGIKQEMEYLGNTYQTEYAGYDVRDEKN